MKTQLSLDTSEFPKELLVLLLWLQPEGDGTKAVSYEKLDWGHLMEFIRHHRVSPTVYHACHDRRCEHEVPSSFLRSLQQEYRRNTFQMLHLSAEMARIGQSFEDGGIPAVFLKGPALAYSLYGDVSRRMSCDLDILIPIDRLEEAETLLTEMGYRKDDYIQTVLNDWKWRHHHITFVHPEKGIKTEIHWRLNPGPSWEPSFKELWERKKICLISGRSLNVLGPGDCFLFLLSHGARHGWSRLRWLADIDQLMRRGIEWTVIEKMLKKYKLVHVGGQALLLASCLLNTPLPDEMRALLRHPRSVRLAQSALFYLKQMVRLHNEPLPAEVSLYHKRYLYRLMPFRQKVLFLLSFLYPYYEDSVLLPLPRRMHFLYFPLRPVLWMWRKLG